MSEKDKASNIAVPISVGAAIAAAWALLGRRTTAASQIIGLDTPTMELIIAIAQACGDIDSNTSIALDKLQELIDISGTGGGQGWPTNAASVRSFVVACPFAATAYQAGYMEIPDGMSLNIKASPANAAASFIYVARTPAECTNVNSSWPLVWNESITYQIKNANLIYVSTNIAGSIAIFTAEQRQ